MSAHEMNPTPEQELSLSDISLPNAELARQWGINRATVSRWRRDRGIIMTPQAKVAPTLSAPTRAADDLGPMERPSLVTVQREMTGAPVVLPASARPERRAAFGGSRQHESAILTFSDAHYGKATASYSPGVFEVRLRQLGERLAHIRTLLSDYAFDELIVAMLGDQNDGSGIYATQPHHQAITNVEEQAWDLSGILAPWLVDVQNAWGCPVHVKAVCGNHGRTGRFMHESASWDMVHYRYLGLRLQQSGIDLEASDAGNPFIHKVKLRGHNYLLYHGHEVKSYQSVPWYGMLTRLTRWNTTKLAPFDVALMGHFHTFGDWQINRIRMMASGTMVTDDEWALQSLGWESTAKWHLFGCSDARPVTWQFGLDLA